MVLEHEKFMEIALKEARLGEAEGNDPVGSVIVQNGEVIAIGRNKARTDLDLTAHAETVALRNVGPLIGHMDLTGCTLYTTFEPCMMCAGAIAFSKVDTVVMGGNYNRHYGGYGDYSVEGALASIGYANVKVIRGVFVEACEEMFWRARGARKGSK